MHRRWLVSRTNRQYIEYLSRSVSISPPIAQVLINRGIKSPSDVKSFLSGGTFTEPLDMPGMKEAVEALIFAKKAGKRVLVHGDYDVDGVTATAIMVKGLRALGFDVQYYVPDRFRDGYGFGERGLLEAKNSGAGLIITVDCGITSFEACRCAKKDGIGVIVTDHHKPYIVDNAPLMPDALSVVYPKEGESLSGAGVALKVIEALGLEREEFLDLAALGTVADSVSLIGENRAIVREGLELLRPPLRAGIRALSEVSALNGRAIRTGTLSFTLIPRINAAGRLANAKEAVELFLTDDESRAAEIADSLNRLNTQRQKTEERVIEEALSIIEKKGVLPAIVLAKEDWHEGVIGIVASRIMELYYRPTFMLSIKGQTAKGSARSIPEFDIHSGLLRVKDILLGFGGHRQAAGLSISKSNIGDFEQRICKIVEEEVRDFTPTIVIDADVGLNEITFNLTREISLLEPFGYGNPEPIFGSRGLEVINPRVVGNNHLKMKLRSGGTSIDSIGFDMGGIIERLNSGTIDAVYTAAVNEWEGGRNLQLNLKAIRPVA